MTRFGRAFGFGVRLQQSVPHHDVRFFSMIVQVFLSIFVLSMVYPARAASITAVVQALRDGGCDDSVCSPVSCPGSGSTSTSWGSFECNGDGDVSVLTINDGATGLTALELPITDATSITYVTMRV